MKQAAVDPASRNMSPSRKNKNNSQVMIKESRSLMASMLQAPATVYSNFGNTEVK